ncbi:MAG: hypothetical protein RLZZ184_1429 [Cyanobacteriota bacterium]|jgi:hypothetical protein
MTLETNLDQVKDIAKKAAIWAYPIVENYRSIYKLTIDSNNASYKGPMNEIHHVRNVATPDDTVFVTPNSDTPYSYLIMDLRTEPLVVTMPDITSFASATGKDRYYSLQLIDLYTFNFEYLGTRRGQQGGTYIIAGPDWSEEESEKITSILKSETNPEGIIDEIIKSETNLVFSLFRTQLFDPADSDDLAKVNQIQDQYEVQTLSQFMKTEPAPESAPNISYPEINDSGPENGEKLDPNFFQYVNFLLQFCPTHPTEVELREQFKTIGMREDFSTFPPAGVSAEWVNALNEGSAIGMNTIVETAEKTPTSLGIFGTRKELLGDDGGQNNGDEPGYLNRAMGAFMGIYGNSDAEAVYPVYLQDSEGQPLNASKHNYELKLELPMPVEAFWSVTMYDGLTKFLVANEPLNRYLINSSMTLTPNEDQATITLYLQNESPGEEKESNWLPAPAGLMFVVMRLYRPQYEVISGIWKPPVITGYPK